MITITQFEEFYTQDVIDLVLHFQNDGTRPIVTVADQPDLLHITDAYFRIGGSFWIARDGEKLAGTIGIMPCGNGVAVLKKFFVYEKYQGEPSWHIGSTRKPDSGKYQKMNCRCGSAIPMRTAISFCWNYSVLEERIDMMQTETRYIRPAAERDAGRIAEIIVTNYRTNFYPFFRNDAYYFDELNVLDMVKEYAQSSEGLRNSAVYDDGIVKGVIRISGTEIEKLYVEPQFQSQGIGAALLRFAVQKKNAASLWVLEYNTRGIAFYERNGFRLTGEKILEDEWVPLLKMEYRKGENT